MHITLWLECPSISKRERERESWRVERQSVCASEKECARGVFLCICIFFLCCFFVGALKISIREKRAQGDLGGSCLRI